MHKLTMILMTALAVTSQAGVQLTKDGKVFFDQLPGGNLADDFPVAARPPDYKPTGQTRDYYLDMMEPIVKLAANWVDEKGAVIDPVLHREWGQTSPRFASAGAVLIHFNRLPELKEKVYRVMDYTCDKLSRLEVKKCSPDFWMRELTVAVVALTHVAPPERVARWRDALAKVSPEDVYSAVDKTGQKIARFNNWCLFGASGEAMRQAMGITGPEGVFWGNTFFDRYLEPQYIHFTENGMYRDPNDPFTYDITTRFQLSCALMWGYRGRNFEKLNDLLRKAALTMLRYVSPQGYVPFGGRSAQFQFQEAMTAAMCEMEALRYKGINPRVAGMFKRQAHRSAQLIYPYLVGESPHRHIKNYFDPNLLHGCDSYGQYSVYSLLSAGFLGMAALYADDTIEEAPTLSEWTSYAFYLRGAFHKIFVNCQGNGFEYDTRAQLTEDATGMGRILLKGVPYGLLPALPFALNPKYKIAEGFPQADYPASIAPCWKNAGGTVWRLAQKVKEEDNEYTVLEQKPEKVSIQLKWNMKGATISEIWTVTPTEITLDGELGGDCQDGVWEVPILENDGKHQPVVAVDGNSLTATMDGGAVVVAGTAAPSLEEQRVTNRTGIYKVYRFPVDEKGRIRLVFKKK